MSIQNCMCQRRVDYGGGQWRDLQETLPINRDWLSRGAHSEKRPCTARWIYEICEEHFIP